MDQLALSAAKSDPKSFKMFKHSMITSTLGKRTLRVHRLLKASKKLSASQLRELELPSALPQKDGKPDKTVFSWCVFRIAI